MIYFEMDAHPIPQNVTAFQFRLVGDMTLKQFFYLAGGVVIAYFTFITLSATLPIIAWPIIILSSLSGAAFAFVPISDRPLDHWILAFLKAVYSPTKMTWKKNGKNYTEEPLFLKRFNVFYSAPTIQPSITPPTPVRQADLPTPEQLGKTVDLAKEAQTLQTQIVETQRHLAEIKNTAQNPNTNPTNYAGQINQVLTNLQGLVTEAADIKKEMAETQPQPVTSRTPVKVTIVTPTRQKQTQIVLTTQPNVINGIITDSINNYLENVVVVIYDKQGLPVRALKTNKLGQFSGATPLPNGTYKIELEKDNLLFDALQIELDGKILPPLVVAAKKIL